MAWKRYYLADGMGNKRVKFNCLSAYYHAINTLYSKDIYMLRNGSDNIFGCSCSTNIGTSCTSTLKSRRYISWNIVRKDTQ